MQKILILQLVTIRSSLNKGWEWLNVISVVC